MLLSGCKIASCCCTTNELKISMTSPKAPVLNSRVSLHQAATRPGDQAKTLVTVHVSVTIPLHCPFPPLFLELQTQCISYNPTALDGYTYPKQSDRFKFDWYCLHYFARNSLVALLEALFAREPEIDMIMAKAAARF